MAKAFGISRRTVQKWCKRKFFKDRIRRAKEPKITRDVEEFILFLRVVFEWDTGRIQNGLFSLPEFMYEEIPKELRDVRGIRLSRTAINNILRIHKKNGYSCHKKKWKFFRATKPNELWQLDFKVPVYICGKKYWFVICIDDYSRYLLLSEQLDFCPTTQVTFQLLLPLIMRYRPERILTDNGPQFSEEWKRLCEKMRVIPIFAHPYYPQDKGKVERTIRNIAEEFTNLLKKFPNWLNGQINRFKDWYNNCRFHRGIGTTPKRLYV